jgi:hypothetical protein
MATGLELERSAASKELSVKRSRTHEVDRSKIAAASATLIAARSG